LFVTKGTHQKDHKVDQQSLILEIYQKRFIQPWPDVKTRAKRFPVGDLAGQQRFLNTVAASVDSTGLPLHARPVLKNLEQGKFEKLSFLTGTLRGLLDKPAEVSRGIRAGSIFMLPFYVWILVLAGAIQGGGAQQWHSSVSEIVLISLISVLGASALIQLLALPFRFFFSHHIFRLAVVNTKGKPAGLSQLFVRWAIVWLPLLLPMLFVALLIRPADSTAAYFAALFLLLLWICAAVSAVIYPHRGLHDRLAGTWVVRR